MNEIFKAVFITSLAGSALAAVISLFRPITKKLFGYSWHYYIWLCVLFVMLMPVRFDVKPQTAPSFVTQTAQTEQTTVGEQPEATENIAQANTAQKPQRLQKAAAIWGRMIYNRMNISAYLWLIGAMALMLLNAVRYIRLNINCILSRNQRVHRQENQCSGMEKYCVAVYDRCFQTDADFAGNGAFKRTIA